MSNVYEIPGWIDKIQEEIIEPGLPIIDPHHHLWHGPVQEQGDNNPYRYLLEDLWNDTGSGHDIKKTVFIDCGQEYYEEGPQEFKPVGETEFVVEIAKQAQLDPLKSQISGIIGHVDMMLGDSAREVLEAHNEKGEGLFRGIRHSGGWDANEAVKNAHSEPTEQIYLEDKFQRGLQQLINLNMVFDTWHYHNQISDLTVLAKALPNLRIVHDHFGGPLGIGPYEGKKDLVFGKWKDDISALSECPNVYSKLGGLAMPINGWNLHKRDLPATSDELVNLHKAYYSHTIESFGVERCMFESNFPVDKQSISYHVLWNAFKKMSLGFSDEEKSYLFYETAKDFYSL
jgi:L-fuconolactonase|tara:strand:- start:256 stop:1284 length:1029 start_codon:yes stop_codon:yes gene_type:complete